MSGTTSVDNLILRPGWDRSRCGAEPYELAYPSCMAHTERVTIGPQGRLVIPAAMRRHLGLEPGSVVLLRLDGDALTLERQEAALNRLRARYTKAAGGPSVVDELLAERREETRRDTEA